MKISLGDSKPRLDRQQQQLQRGRERASKGDIFGAGVVLPHGASAFKLPWPVS